MAISIVATPTSETRLKMGYEEFLAWSDEDKHAEWVNGEAIVFMPPTDKHQATLGFLYTLMRLFVDLFDLGQLRIAPFEMRATAGGSAREPDLMFIAEENLHRLTPKRLAGPADLVVEVISDSSVRRDRADKHREYAAAGIREYWIIDPREGKQRADFYRLGADAHYELVATEDDELFTSETLPAFSLRPAWLWQAATLNPITCALQVPGVAEALARQLRESESSDSNSEG